jgi:hypothetical protein
MTPLPSSFNIEQVMGIAGSQDFNDVAMQIFFHQREKNKVYNTFLKSLGRPEPSTIEEIPCLPIGAFKHHKVLTGKGIPEITFSSSGTTGQQRSKHYVLDKSWYEESFMRHFEQRYGPIAESCIVGLLPSYIEQGDSSLVYMVDKLIARSQRPESGTYLYDHDLLRSKLAMLQSHGVRTILIGVSYALLDFVEEQKINYPELIVMETGGMKGRRKELVREELHALLREGFGISHIHSEYGMTEMLSQAYAERDGLYRCPPWMQIRIRDIMDPFSYLGEARTGGLDIIDLANVNSCSFISTDDLARKHANGSFEVLGRFDQSDIRGCSLLV